MNDGRGARIGCAVFLAAVLAQGAGCGRPVPRLVALAGTVTCDGKPVPTGAIVIVPASDPDLGEGRSPLDEAGRFSIRHDRFPKAEGVPPGRYRIAIVASAPKASNPLGVEYELLVPGRYANPETSGLVVEVPVGEARVNLDLQLTR